MASVFIVEDDKSIQTLYKKYLDLNGFNIIGTANNGEEAVKKYRSFEIKPDIVLMDHRMPIKDGIEATKEILEIDGKTNVLFASADKSIKEEALSMGIIGFLDKPFSLDKLVDKIKSVVSTQKVSTKV